MGRRPHACEALEWLIDEEHDIVTVVAPSGQGSEMPYWSPTLRETARRLGVPVTDFRSFKQDLRSDGLPFGQVDLIVSFLFWRRITPEMTAIARYGCINFHPAPLPNYKGLGGYNFAILHKLSEWGVTAHYVDASFDTGPIISVKCFPFDWRTATAFSLEADTRPVTLELFKEIIDRVSREGCLEAQENVGGRYFTREDMDGGKRIDLSAMDADEVELRARAFWYPPFDGAYIELDGKRFTLVPSDVLASLKSLHQE